MNSKASIILILIQCLVIDTTLSIFCQLFKNTYLFTWYISETILDQYYNLKLLLLTKTPLGY